MSNKGLKVLNQVPTQVARKPERPGSRAVALENPASLVPQKIQDIIGFAPSRLREPKLKACALAISALKEANVELSIVPKPIGAGEVLQLEMSRWMAEKLPDAKAVEVLDGTSCKVCVAFQVRPSGNEMRMNVIPRGNDSFDGSDPQDLENAAEVLMCVLQCTGVANVAAREAEGILREAYTVPRMRAGAANVFASMRASAELGELQEREFNAGIERGLKKQAEEAAKRIQNDSRDNETTGVHKVGGSSDGKSGRREPIQRSPVEGIADAMSALGIKSYKII